MKALIIRNETEEYLLFKKVGQRQLRDVTKKVNADKRHIETDDIIKRNKLAMGCKRTWSEERQEEKKSHGGKEKLEVILST